MKKKLRLDLEKLKRLIPDMGECYASDRIMVDGKPVGFMYRIHPRHPKDSGWRFLAGDETQAFIDDTRNWDIYEVNFVCNFDPAIIPYLHTAPECAFGRVKGTAKFAPEKMPPEPD